MVSVAGLAPARVGLKTRPLELLCINGHENRSQEDEVHRVAVRGQALTLWFRILHGAERTRYRCSARVL